VRLVTTVHHAVLRSRAGNPLEIELSLRKWAILGAALLAAVVGAFGIVRVVHAGPTVSVTVSLSQSFAKAGGTTDVIATASVVSGGLPSIGQRVDFGTDGDATFTTPTTVHTDPSGNATVHLRPGLKLAPQSISALSGGAMGNATLTQHGAATGITLTLSAPTVVADGSSTVNATVTLTDSAANGVPAETVTLGTGGDVKISAPVDQGSGTYTATITASTTPGSETITAADVAASLSASQSLVEKPGAVSAVTVVPDSATLVADGTSTTTATATVADVNGNRIPGETVTFTTDGHVTFGTVTDNGDGTYVVTLTSSTISGPETITATDGSVSGGVKFAEIPGPATSIAMVIPPSLSTTQSPAATGLVTTPSASPPTVT
jgi:adhesin/invasin